MSLEKSEREFTEVDKQAVTKAKWESTSPAPGAIYFGLFKPREGYYIEEAYIYTNKKGDIYMKAFMRENHHCFNDEMRYRTLKFHKGRYELSYRGSYELIHNLDEIIDRLVELKLVKRPELE